MCIVPLLFPNKAPFTFTFSPRAGRDLWATHAVHSHPSLTDRQPMPHRYALTGLGPAVCSFQPFFLFSLGLLVRIWDPDSGVSVLMPAAAGAAGLPFWQPFEGGLCFFPVCQCLCFMPWLGDGDVLLHESELVSEKRCWMVPGGLEETSTPRGWMEADQQLE